MLRITIKNGLFLSIILLFSFSCKQENNAELSLDSLNAQISSLEADLDKLKERRKAKMKEQGLEYIEEDEILSSSASDSTIIIKGIVKSKSKSKIHITLDRPYRSDFARSIPIDKDGKFEKEISVRAPAIYKLNFGDIDSEIYLEPGKMIGLVIDTSAEHTFNFLGDLSIENNHLFSTKAFSKQAAHVHPELEQELGTLFNSILDSTEMFAQNKLNIDLNTNYAELIKNNYLYNSLLGIVNHIKNPELQYNIEQHLDFSKLKIPEAGTSNLSLFSLYAYRKFIFEFFELSCNQIVQDSTISPFDKYSKKYEKVNTLFEDPILQEFIKTDIVFESIRKMKSSELNPLVLKLRKQISNKHYLKTVTDHYKKNIHAGVGTLAPQIEGPSYEGGRINLNDYEGKYVYIFVWATWCGPCKLEIPYYEKLISDFSEGDIEFIGVSVDKDESKWLESFLFQKYPGTQMLVKGDWNSPMIKDFNLRTVPQFILINPKGEIITLSAPSPTKGAASFLSTFGV